MDLKKIMLFFSLLGLFPAGAGAEGSWHGLLHLGQYSARKYHQIPFRSDWDLKSQYMLTIGLGREMARFTRLAGLNIDLGTELEGSVAHHWGDYNPNYQEFVISCNLRWHKFPWNEVLRTSLAHGFGLSCTTRVPEHEVQYHRGKSARLLGYLMWDITFSLPDTPEWAVFFRVHHRSGASGTFSGVHGAANYPAIGIKRLFI